jgi:hypothetical protein
MTPTQRLAERAITFAIAEPDEDMAVARLAFLAHGDHAGLDGAIQACLARRDRSLRTRWRAIGFLARVRYDDHPPPGRPLPPPSDAPTAARSGLESSPDPSR